MLTLRSLSDHGIRIKWCVSAVRPALYSFKNKRMGDGKAAKANLHKPDYMIIGFYCVRPGQYVSKRRKVDNSAERVQD